MERVRTVWVKNIVSMEIRVFYTHTHFAKDCTDFRACCVEKFYFLFYCPETR